MLIQGASVMELAAGKYFGELSILFSLKRAATVRTKTNAKLLSLSKHGLNMALKDHEREAQMIRKEAKKRSAEHAAEEENRLRTEAAKLIRQTSRSSVRRASNPGVPALAQGSRVL